MRIPPTLVRSVGGPLRFRVVLLFACVLALESADLATVGAAGPQLKHALHINNTELGLLAAISTLVGAVATVPAGALTDRVVRNRLLAGAVALWGVAMLAGASAQGYGWLLISRLGLGAVAGAAGPLVASLIGDFFPPQERARIFGYIYSGELVGAGVGFVVTGSIASALSWRWAFAVLIVPALALALAIWRTMPEPERGRQERLRGAAAASDGRPAEGLARRAVARLRVRPRRGGVLREDPATMPLRRAVAYVLSIRTNLWLIAAASIGYFFFAGMRTFGLVFVRGHYSLAQGTATVVLFVGGLGALCGVLVSGRLADRMISQGRIDARVVVGGACYLAAAVVLVPTLLAGTLVIGLPLLFLVGASLSAPNPPLDAARLDIVPSRLWGRAEGVRTLVRQSAQAVAPLSFGLLADAFGGGASVSGSSNTVTAANAHGLQLAFLIMLVPLLLNGLMLLRARRSYPADVATALESEKADREERGRSGEGAAVRGPAGDERGGDQAGADEQERAAQRDQGQAQRGDPRAAQQEQDDPGHLERRGDGKEPAGGPAEAAGLAL